MSQYERRLPPAELQYPTCGACLGETAHDGDVLYCEDCGLDFDPYTLTASYRDDGAEPCGASCANTWHAYGAIRPGWGYKCRTCALPTGHKGSHWTECEVTRDPDDVKEEDDE